MARTSKSFAFASAISDDEEVNDALDEALGGVQEQLGNEPVDLALIFASPQHRRGFPAIGERLDRQLQAHVGIAISAGGVLGSGAELEERAGLSILAARLPDVWLHPFSYDDLNWAGDEEPAELRRAMIGDREESQLPAAVLFFADPFSTPMIKLMPAINRALPGVPVIGGMASGGMSAGSNRMLLGDRILREGAVGVAIGGDVQIDCTVSQGCRPIGQPWIITKARHNVIQNVGRRPVLQAIQSTAEEAEPHDQALLQEHGLLVGRVINEYKDRFGRGDFLVRNVIGADQDAGYIAVSDLVRVGQTIQFHVRDRSTAEEDLRLLLQQQQLYGPASGALLCTCNGRGRRLFNEPNAESNIIRNALGHIPLAGFFAAGEIGPIGDRNFVHGFTASLAVFRPKTQHRQSEMA